MLPQIVLEKEKYQLAQIASSTVGGANYKKELWFNVLGIYPHEALVTILLLLQHSITATRNKNRPESRLERKHQSSPKCLKGRREVTIPVTHRKSLSSSLDVSPIDPSSRLLLKPLVLFSLSLSPLRLKILVWWLCTRCFPSPCLSGFPSLFSSHLPTLLTLPPLFLWSLWASSLSSAICILLSKINTSSFLRNSP